MQENDLISPPVAPFKRYDVKTAQSPVPMKKSPKPQKSKQKPLLAFVTREEDLTDEQKKPLRAKAKKAK